MKKLLLSFAVTVVAAMNVQAQSCSPSTNPNYADSVYGVWPDTTTNFPPATQNAFYSTNLNFKVPSTVTAEVAGSDPTAQGFIGQPIQGFQVTDVVGLPVGYDYACNISGCSYNGGAAGCANVFGTTAETGVYNVTIKITAVVTVIGIEYPTEFSGYKIVVGAAGTIEQVIAPIVVSPNPANDEIKIEGISASMKASKVEITNIEGKVVASKEVANSSNFSFDLAGMNAGIYFVNVTHASGVETVKFIKN
jgi:hypothetical protein